MNAQKIKKLNPLFNVADGILSVAVLALAGYIVELVYKLAETGDKPMNWSLLSLMFVVMAVSQGLLIIKATAESHTEVIRHSVYLVAFLVCAVLVFLSPQNSPEVMVNAGACMRDFHFRVATFLFVGVLIFSRVLTMLRDRTRNSVIFNLMAILAIVACMIDADIISLILMIVIHTVGHISAIAFGRLDMRTLMKIIRKTYAAEILFGIVLLIVAFSVLLAHLEEGIGSFRNALWYCFAIVTTIGFGDYSAVTTMGRILSVILGLYGLIVVALITSVIVNFYGEMKSDDEESKEEKE